MAEIINTQDWGTPLSPMQKRWVYNGLDCCVTVEVLKQLLPKLEKPHIYQFTRAMNDIARQMTETGVAIDPRAREEKERTERAHLEQVKLRLEHLLSAFGYTSFNPGSHYQVKELAYEVLGLKRRYDHKAKKDGEDKLTSSRQALESLRDDKLAYRPIFDLILEYRDSQKRLGTIKTKLSQGRWHAAFNVVGTETGRWSSSSSHHGFGANLQNITSNLRDMFIADSGYKLAYIDLEQAESRIVAMLVYLTTGDRNLLDACHSGDLHTSVASMVWPEVVSDRPSAEQLFYRDKTYRDMAKGSGHATNYYATPFALSRQFHYPIKVAESFRDRYFKAFPGIKKWHTYVTQQLQTKFFIDSPYGRRRYFFNRPYEDQTIREAIAYAPQSAIGDLLNEGAHRINQHFPQVKLLANVHDALLLEYPENEESQLLPQLISAMEIPIEYDMGTGRSINMTIPAEAAVGWNWGYSNVDGLKKWKGIDERTRQWNPQTKILDRSL